ncbi:MAG TPA: hypothetical protein V6C58_08025 [Allocoleopsis sp.]
MTFTDIDLIEKIYDSNYIGKWMGERYKEAIFTDIYLQDRYSNDFHYLKYVQLWIISDSRKDNHFLLYDVMKRNKNDRMLNLENDDKRVVKYMNKYKNTYKRFTYFPLVIYSKKGNHFVSFLYDRKENTLERYDSSVIQSSRWMNIKIKNFFKKIYGDLRFIFDSKCQYFTIKEIEFCSEYIKYQRYYSKGFCIVWSLWLIELRLKNKHLDRNTILLNAKKIFNRDPEKLCKIIRGYGQFIDSLIKKYKIVGNISDILYYIENIYKKTPKNDSLFRLILNKIALFVGIPYRNI